MKPWHGFHFGCHLPVCAAVGGESRPPSLIAPVYARVSRILQGTFAQTLFYVMLALKLALLEHLPPKSLKALPRPPQSPHSVGSDVFRADVAANEDVVGIGDWETFHTIDTSVARRFSLRLSRKDSPWLPHFG